MCGYEYSDTKFRQKAYVYTMHSVCLFGEKKGRVFKMLKYCFIMYGEIEDESSFVDSEERHYLKFEALCFNLVDCM